MRTTVSFIKIRDWVLARRKRRKGLHFKKKNLRTRATTKGASSTLRNALSTCSKPPP